MPILDVEIVLRPGEPLGSDIAARLARQVAETLSSALGQTWIKVRALPKEQYAENGTGPAEGVCPVFVSVLKAKLPSPEALQAEVSRLTQTIAQVCARSPENVHIVYEPEGAGRAAFGGKLVAR
jgi:phenylpyruvate tautomerase PptA (4-oxalocrotonate tautomerase family)